MTTYQSIRGGALSIDLNQFNAALASTGESLIATDALGTVTFVNSAALQLTGWLSSEALGMPIEQVFNVADLNNHPAQKNPVLKALQESRVIRIKLTSLVNLKTSVQQVVEGSAAPVFNGIGEVTGTLVVFRDANESACSECRVEIGRDLADDQLENIQNPCLVLDCGLQVLRINNAFCKAFAVSQLNAKGLYIFKLNEQCWDTQNVRDALDGVRLGHYATKDCCVTINLPETGRRLIALSIRRLKAGDDVTCLIMVTFNDITGGHRLDTSDQGPEGAYKRLFESARDGIIVLDAKTLRIIDANQFIAELLGYSVLELLGRELWEIGVATDKSASQSAGRELQERGYVRYRHLPLETKGGKRIDVDVISNVYSVNQLVVAQCNIRDISAHSKMERKLQEQTDALAELHSKKDEFLAMLSHELRNPLAPMANAVRLLRLQRDEDPVQSQARGIIERQLIQLTRLVDDLMEVSRISTGRVILRNDIVAAGTIIEDAVETVRHLMELRRHQVNVSLSNRPIWVYGDAARLEQIFVNLLTNAAKYTEEGGKITVTLDQEHDDSVVRIRDTGVGIAPALLPHVFDFFTQAERSLDRSRGGLGVGLALVRSLVQMHDGQVNVSSVEGQGSEFVVRFPAVMAPSQESRLDRSETAKPVDAVLRVLVVDDSTDTAESMSMLVETLGHNVRVAYEGNAALIAFREFKPDVVLLDIGLPGLTGYEVATQIRAQDPVRSVILVAITGYGQKSDRQLALAAGFDHHLVKPVDFDKVTTILGTASRSSPGIGMRAP